VNTLESRRSVSMRLDRFRQDGGYAARALRRSPGFAFAVVLTLAIGVGATTAVFTLADPMLFRPLPYPESDRLVQLLGRAGGSSRVLHVPDFLRAQDTAVSFEAIAAFGLAPVGGRIAGRAEAPLGYEVSRRFFDVLRVRPFIGREFLPEEYRVNAAADVAILTFPFWQSAFAGRPGVLAESLTLERPARRFRIVGVLPQDFVLPDAVNRAPDFFVAYAPDPGALGNPNRLIWPIARLAPGSTMESATGEMQSVLGSIEREYPAFERNRQARVRSLREGLFGPMKTPLLMLLGATGSVLLLACVNLAHLFLSRMHARRTELAVRMALGASRAGLARLLFVEASMLAAIGGTAALMVGQWTFDLIMVRTPKYDHIYRLLPATLDARVAIFATLLAGIALAIFGAVPALRASDVDLRSGLIRETPRSTRRIFRGGGRLITLQCAVAVTLLVTSTLLVRSFVSLAYQPLGFDPGPVRIVALASGRGEGDLSIADRRRVYEHLRQRLPVPVTVASGWPAATLPGFVTLRDAPPPAPTAAAYPAASTMAEVLGLRVAAGRFYSESEAFTNAAVAVVDGRAAEQFWPGQDPLGKEVIDETGVARRIIGVVNPLRTTLTNDDAGGVAFHPFGVQPRFMEVAMRDPRGSISTAQVQAAIDEVPPATLVTIRSFTPFERTLGQPRFLAALLGALGFLTVALTIVGVFGVVQHDAARRTREMGIRISLGATAGRILAMVLSRALVPALFGMIAGVGVSLWWTRTLASLLFGVEPTDAATFAIACGLVAGVVLLASLWPAWRASRVDPVVALRFE
jgi:putative ABC transport system permease protein